MNRLTTAWFEFDSVKTSAKGLILCGMPNRATPAERGEWITIPGRAGGVWIGENGAREPITIDIECESADSGYTPESVNSWLLGKSALLRFSDDTGYAYKARCVSAISHESKFTSFDKKLLRISFECQPHKYVYPAPSATTITTSGGTITNGGTAESLPKITVTATGAYTVTVNGYLIEVTGGSVIIDSEIMDCFDTDGVTLANSRVTLSEYPRLSAGSNTVTWTGSVTSVAILPRSRAL